jgi:hypothetical protein
MAHGLSMKNNPNFLFFFINKRNKYFNYMNAGAIVNKIIDRTPIIATTIQIFLAIF